MNANKILSGIVLQDLKDVTNSRWKFTYAFKENTRYPHIIVLQVAPGLDDTLTKSLLNLMYNNSALNGLIKGKNYSRGGLSTIAFRAKENAALFLLFAIL